jgi:hypothetical protein
MNSLSSSSYISCSSLILNSAAAIPALTSSSYPVAILFLRVYSKLSNNAKISFLYSGQGLLYPFSKSSNSILSLLSSTYLVPISSSVLSETSNSLSMA